MNFHLSCVAVIAVTGFGLSACVPKHKTIRPKAEIVVTDSSGAPIENAAVVLGTVREPFGPVSKQEFFTGQNGKISFEAIREWETDIYLPDGVSWYEWTLCVSQPGFQAVAILKPEFERPVQISLSASEVNSECYWPRDQNWPEVVHWKSGAWIEVEGGAWEVNAPHIAGVRERMQSFAEPQLQARGRELRPWSEYLFQYQGRYTGTTPFVYIKALCRTPPDVNLRKTFYEAADGDACFFAVTYDATRDRFDSIEVASR